MKTLKDLIFDFDGLIYVTETTEINTWINYHLNRLSITEFFGCIKTREDVKKSNLFEVTIPNQAIKCFGFSDTDLVVDSLDNLAFTEFEKSFINR